MSLNVMLFFLSGDFVAHIKFTVLLMPNGSDRITTHPLQELQPTKTVDDPEIKAWLALGTKTKKKGGGKKKKGKAWEIILLLDYASFCSLLFFSIMHGCIICFWSIANITLFYNTTSSNFFRITGVVLSKKGAVSETYEASIQIETDIRHVQVDTNNKLRNRSNWSISVCARMTLVRVSVSDTKYVFKIWSVGLRSTEQDMLLLSFNVPWCGYFAKQIFLCCLHR